MWLTPDRAQAGEIRTSGTRVLEWSTARYITGSDRASARYPSFRWANTMLANVKNSLLTTHRVVGAKHLPRDLGAFAFNRRFGRKTIHEGLAIVATASPPMPHQPPEIGQG